ncbi:MAG: hypothetical protein A3J83_04705 [Elusimicrobia bacterium RIFOXYA2_FULL_40_6]|nr:MAG: hypothetical protein A3J83_04705 [Elusimicrobia bacterium RIFOXYA2_FULL_40_6]
MPKKILIVDDEPGVRDVLKKVLEKSYEITQAKDGLEAVELLNDNSFDLVISDIRMPRKGGVDLLKKVKSNYVTLPFIMITGFGDIEEAVKTIKLGASDYITKPFDIDDILITVEKCLSDATNSLEAVSMKQCMSLYEIFHQKEESSSPDEMLSIILKKSLETIKASSGSITLLNEKLNMLEVIVSFGLNKKIDKLIPVGERIVGRIFKENKPMILHNGLKRYSQFKDIKVRNEIVSSMVIPLRSQGKVIGTMNFNRLSDFPFKFTELELNTMELFGSYISSLLVQLVAQRKSVELETLKKEFLGNISHELRTPLMSIMGAVELAQDLDDKETSKNLLQVIQRNSLRLDSLVKDLLDYSKMDSGTLKYNFYLTSVTELINDLYADFENKFKTKNISFSVDIPENISRIEIDTNRIKQVIANLLSNAYKFTGDNGRVKLSAEDSNGGAEILIKVEDNGAGISEFEQAKIFERFYQVDGSTTRKVDGTGLGLTISRTIVEAHGGKISVESQLGKGSVFIVSLPKRR